MANETLTPEGINAGRGPSAYVLKRSECDPVRTRTSSSSSIWYSKSQSGSMWQSRVPAQLSTSAWSRDRGSGATGVMRHLLILMACMDPPDLVFWKQLVRSSKFAYFHLLFSEDHDLLPLNTPFVLMNDHPDQAEVATKRRYEVRYVSSESGKPRRFFLR